MKSITTLFIGMLFSVNLVAQGNLFEDQVFKVQNHGKDYPTKDFYTFGQASLDPDQKHLTSNDKKIDASASLNGVVVTVYYKSNIGWGSDDDPYIAYYTPSDYTQRAGEYRFDWMTSATTIDNEVVDAFIDLMNTLPEQAVVSMYTGYYHGIDQMPEAFYKAVESVRSEEIRNLSAKSVWAFVGSKCSFEPVQEAYSDDSDALVEVAFQPYRVCGATSIAEKSAPVEGGVRVFPNPADKFLSVTTQATDVEVVIYDLTGQLQLVTTQTDRIDISELSKGIYIVQVKTSQKTFSSRITKR